MNNPRQQPQQNPPLSFQDLMGLFAMMNNQTQQGIQNVNQLQEFQQRQQENPLRMQVLQNQAMAPEQAKQEMILRAASAIKAPGLYDAGGNEAATREALRQLFGFDLPPGAMPQADQMAQFQALIQ